MMGTRAADTARAAELASRIVLSGFAKVSDAASPPIASAKPAPDTAHVDLRIVRSRSRLRMR